MAAWAETGLFPVEDLLKLRRLDSDLEGHTQPLSKGSGSHIGKRQARRSGGLEVAV